MQYLSLVSIIIAVAALGISTAAYLLSRKMPNENKIFDEKIRCYQVLIKAMNDTVSVILFSIGEYATLKSERARKLLQRGEELEDDIDNAFFDLEDAIAENSLVVPDNILEQLYDFLDLLNYEEYLETFSKQAVSDDLEDKTNDAFDKIVVAMQQDVGFEKLDKGLKHRTGAKREAIKRLKKED